MCLTKSSVKILILKCWILASVQCLTFNPLHCTECLTWQFAGNMDILTYSRRWIFAFRPLYFVYTFKITGQNMLVFVRYWNSIKIDKSSPYHSFSVRTSTDGLFIFSWLRKQMFHIMGLLSDMCGQLSFQI